MPEEVKPVYYTFSFRPQVGDVVRWHECDPGTHHYLVTSEPVLKWEEPHKSEARLADAVWEWECIHLDSNTKSVLWYEARQDQYDSGYILVSRVDSPK
jgi:hypothetical protein